MARNPYFDILFEPVRIGPVTTKNRFYQVPHATAHGYKMPNGHAGVRGVKAEGGWGVVNTDLVSIHPTYNRRMTSQLIVDKQSKQQHNLSDMRICCI